jgi:AbiTii
MLLDKLIDLATDNQQPLTVLLRQCIVLAYELKNEQLKEWANHELNGYSNQAEVPKYRTVAAGATGVFRAGYMFPAIKRSIPGGAMEEAHRKFAEEVHLFEPVSAYENSLNAVQSGKGQAMAYKWNADLITYYQEAFIEGHALVDAWQEVPMGVIAGMLDTIRTRVLNMALELKSEIGESDADLKKVKSSEAEAEKVNSIVLTQIFGGTVYMAAGQQNVNVQNIAVGDWEDLKKVLNESGLGEKDVAELSQALHQDNKTMGATVKGWISRNAGKVFNSGLQVGVSVGTTILTQYIKRHLGLPP